MKCLQNAHAALRNPCPCPKLDRLVLAGSRRAGVRRNFALEEAAVAGLGVAIAPQPLVSEDIASGRLVAPWGFVEAPGRWVLCCRRNDMDPRIARLADWLRRELDIAPR